MQIKVRMGPQSKAKRVMTSHRYPISEIFGPTRQGEGPQAGMYTFFVRFAGCDWDCGFGGYDKTTGKQIDLPFVCDTRYAVGPKYKKVGWHVDRMTSAEIIQKLIELGAEQDDWITLSGGNPALFLDQALSDDLRLGAGFRLAMETQGSRGADKFPARDIDCLIVSPKPPSSGMDKRFDLSATVSLLVDKIRLSRQITAVKIVAFNEEDMNWAVEKRLEIIAYARERADPPEDKNDKTYPLGHVQWYMSAGTPIEIHPEYGNISEIDAARLQIAHGLTDLWLASFKEPKKYKDWVMLAQNHVSVWGQKAGV